MAVFVLDRQSKALMPCSERRARQLLARGRARVHRVMPFVVRLIDRQADTCTFQPLRLKLDLGSKATGLALVRESERVEAETGKVQRETAVLSLFDLLHRGAQISKALTARSSMRGNLRYCAPRFLNRGYPKGCNASSLQHRDDRSLRGVRRLQRWAPLTALSCERVRFDMQLMENPEIKGVEYQQSTLKGYEVREYLLEKWKRTCAYCGAQNEPLQIEHIDPKARGSSNRMSNQALAYALCNTAKDALPVEVFLKHDPVRLATIKARAKRPLKDAAAVNATRWTLVAALTQTCLPVECATGGRTKFNRIKLSIPKTHALDAVCVGELSAVSGWRRATLQIKSTGRGCYLRTRLTEFGFPRGYLTRAKRIQGFQTGDRVWADVPSGKKTGTHTGRVAVRASGSFNIQTPAGLVQRISHRHGRLIQRSDGYGYGLNPKDSFDTGEARGGRAARDALSLTGLQAGVSRAKTE